MADASRVKTGFWGRMMSPERRGPLLVAPAIIILLVMNIFPLLWSFGLSFFNYRANRLKVPRISGLRQLCKSTDRRENLGPVSDHRSYRRLVRGAAAHYRFSAGVVVRPATFPCGAF